MAIDHAAWGHRSNDDPGQEAVAGRVAQPAGGIPVTAAGVGKSLLRFLGKRIGGLRFRAAEVERSHGRHPRIERRRHRGNIAAPRDRSQDDDLLLVHSRMGHQDIDAAHRVQDHPAHQAFADQVELNAGIRPRIVILPGPIELAGITFGVGKRMLPALAVAELVRHEHDTTEFCPVDPHVLKLGLALGLVKAVDEKQAGHRGGWFRRPIEVRRDRQPRPALEYQVIDAITIAFDGSHHPRFGCRIPGWPGRAKRLDEGPDACIAEPLPVALGGYRFPNLGLLLVSRVDARRIRRATMAGSSFCLASAAGITVVSSLRS